MDLVYSINPQNSYRTAWEEFQKAGHGRHSCKRRLHQELRLCSPRAWENKPQSRGRMCEPHTGTGLWAEWERDSQSTSEDDLIRGRTDTRAVTAEGAQMARDTGQDAACRSSLGKHTLRLRQMSRCTSHRLVQRLARAHSGALSLSMADIALGGSLRKGMEVPYKVAPCSQPAIPGSKCSLKSPVLKRRSSEWGCSGEVVTSHYGLL